MNIQPTRDWNKLRGILMHPEIQERIVEDRESPNWVSEEMITAAMGESFSTPLLVSSNGTPIAVYVFFYVKPGVYDIHIQVLPEHRAEYAVSATRLAIRWAWDHLNMRRLEATIPTKYPDAFKHVLKVGFILRDVLDNDFRQDGRTYASYYMVMYNNGNRSSSSRRTVDSTS